jgi:FkbM family methyltransferase
MNRFFRNIRKGIRRALNVKRITLDGIIVSTERESISKCVRQGLFKGTYEEPERILIREALTPNDRVLEIGGGIGFVSLLCAKICGAQNVLTYEANPAMVATIQRNYALNSLTPALRSKAIAPEPGEVTFFIDDNIVSSSLHTRAGKPHTVAADSLRAVLAEWKPTAIVMDIEGGETTVLPSARLDGIEKIVVELHPQIVGDAAIAALKSHLNQFGFTETRSIHKTSLFTRNARH